MKYVKAKFSGKLNMSYTCIAAVSCFKLDKHLRSYSTCQYITSAKGTQFK